MTRAIKFRIWNGTHMYKPLIEGSMDISEYLSELKCVMQYTGLKDMNGKEIYEGDVLSVEKKASLYENLEVTVIGYVFYSGGKYDVKILKVINPYFLTKGNIYFGVKVMEWIHLSNFFEAQIIGNIYGNPELLK
jgi:uncharacterized phage protein (TIGR01671 family)